MKKHKDLTRELAKNLKECVLDNDPGDEQRLIRVLGELKMGFAFLETLKCDHVITMFGSARTKKSGRYYALARELAEKLGKAGKTVLTGGGPGIMEAANRGALEAGARSIGINIYLNNGERRNKYVKEGIGCYYFFNRKVLLAYSAEGYIFFPGGYGTLDEFFEICTLVATGKIDKSLPIVLIGKSFWRPLVNWMKKTIMKKHRAITLDETKIFTLTDSVNTAFSLIQKGEKIVHRHEST